MSKLLEQQPHPNIVQAVDTAYPEGIYLRRYLKHSEIATPTQPRRILWYQDILRALLHLHKLGIAHSDLRIDNVLFDEQGHAFLCDFSSCSAFGELNHESPHPEFPFPLNGIAKTFSDATDMFAMGSLIFWLEFGHKPELAAENGVVVLPPVHTGHDGLDSMVRKAWLGKYASTEQMLRDAEALQRDKAQDPRNPVQPVSKGELRERVRRWRRDREEHHGRLAHRYMDVTSIAYSVQAVCSTHSSRTSNCSSWQINMGST
jgi:serine/threonine protein kinase